MTHWSERRAGGVVTLVHANPPRHTLTAAGVGELAARAEALDAGIVHRVFPAASFPAEVERFVSDLAARAAIALAAAKRAIRERAELPLAEGLALEQEQFERTMRSRDAAGAMRAFLRGERHEWKGE